MVISPFSLTEIANELPGFVGRIPPQDLGEVVIVIIKTAGHIDIIVNNCSS